MRYEDAGVSVTRSDAIKDAVIREIRSTWNADVAPLVGGFAGVMRLPSPPGTAGAPGLLAATMDGVGTKLHLAQAAGRLADAAADLVYHGANDLLVHGARPLAFLDYLAQSRLDPEAVLACVRGLARACREVGAALLGGETAEMPDTYLPGVIDVAGCMLGTVGGSGPLDGARVSPGDRVLGLAGSGLHTNGYSLARRVLAASELALDRPLPGGAGESVGEALLAPHRWYGRALLPLVESGRIRALAHVTGGGIAGNLVRVLPAGVQATVERSAWVWPATFRALQALGDVETAEMERVFNLGVGMILVLAPAHKDAALAQLTAAGEHPFRIGAITAGERSARLV